MTVPLILVTGAAGQLGQTLSQLWGDAPLSNFQFLALDRSQLDIANVCMTKAVLDELSPTVIVNAAAYTQVDKAETEADSAYQINEEGAATLASWAAERASTLIQISTDFIFDGKGSAPYDVGAAANPLGVYGASKLAGEQRVLELAAGNSAVVRTSWLYSEYGNNFLKTMLRLMAERDKLSVVNDQVGSPTSTHGLAQLIFAMIAKGDYDGVYHWTDGGCISWYDFAVEIQKQALANGMLEREIPVHPITASEYPTPAQRPSYSVLDRSRAMEQFECSAQDWKAQLSVVLTALGSAGEA